MTWQSKLGMCQIRRPGTSNNQRNYTRMIFLGNTQQSTHLAMAFPRGRNSSTACSDETASCKTHSTLSTDCKEGVRKIEGLTFPFFSDSTSRSGGCSSESARNTEKSLWGKSSPEHLHSSITEILVGVAFFHFSKGQKPVPWLRSGGHRRYKEFTEFIPDFPKGIKWYFWKIRKLLHLLNYQV